MSPEPKNLHTFVEEISANSNNGKAICNFRRVPSIISMYRSMVAYKNVAGLPNVLTPEVSVENSNNKLSFSFKSNEINDFKQFSDCIKRNCQKTVSIKENAKKDKVLVKL